MKKSIIMAMMITLICCILWGCGKSEAVKNVEVLIDGIGEVTVDSEENIKKAEDAYGALSDKEKEQVENADQLPIKRKALEECIAKEEEEKKKAELAPYVGKWQQLYAEVLENEYEYKKNDWLGTPFRTKKIEIKESDKHAKVKEDGLHLTIDRIEWTFNLIEDHGITKLVSGLGVFVRPEDYENAKEKMFVHVILDEDNIENYIGEPELIGEYTYYNEWGDEKGTTDLYVLKSPVYDDEDLIMLTNKDVRYEIYFKDNTDPLTVHEPYPLLWNWYGEPRFEKYGRAEGEIWYVRKEYVDNISEKTSKNRMITFTDGFSAVFEVPDTSNTDFSVTDFEF